MGNIPLCVFSIPRVFYRCPTSLATMLKKYTATGGRIFSFSFTNPVKCNASPIITLPTTLTVP